MKLIKIFDGIAGDIHRLSQRSRRQRVRDFSKHTTTGSMSISCRLPRMATLAVSSFSLGQMASQITAIRIRLGHKNLQAKGSSFIMLALMLNVQSSLFLVSNS